MKLVYPDLMKFSIKSRAQKSSVNWIYALVIIKLESTMMMLRKLRFDVVMDIMNSWWCHSGLLEHNRHSWELWMKCYIRILTPSYQLIWMIYWFIPSQMPSIMSIWEKFYWGWGITSYMPNHRSVPYSIKKFLFVACGLRWRNSDGKGEGSGCGGLS